MKQLFTRPHSCLLSPKLDYTWTIILGPHIEELLSQYTLLSDLIVDTTLSCEDNTQTCILSVGGALVFSALLELWLS